MELLQAAKTIGAITAWSVEGRYITLRTETELFSGCVSEARAALRRMIAEAVNGRAD